MFNIERLDGEPALERLDRELQSKSRGLYKRESATGKAGPGIRESREMALVSTWMLRHLSYLVAQPIPSARSDDTRRTGNRSTSLKTSPSLPAGASLHCARLDKPRRVSCTRSSGRRATATVATASEASCPPPPPQQQQPQP